MMKRLEVKMLIAILWAVVITGIAVMRKIEPHNWVCPIYAVTIAVLATISVYHS